MGSSTPEKEGGDFQPRCRAAGTRVRHGQVPGRSSLSPSGSLVPTLITVLITQPQCANKPRMFCFPPYLLRQDGGEVSVLQGICDTNTHGADGEGRGLILALFTACDTGSHKEGPQQTGVHQTCMSLRQHRVQSGEELCVLAGGDLLENHLQTYSERMPAVWGGCPNPHQSARVHPNASFLMQQTPDSSKWGLKCLSPCHPGGRPQLNF